MQNYRQLPRVVFQEEWCGKASLVRRTHDGYDARDSYERAGDALGENVHNGNDDIESNGRRFQETSSEVEAATRSLIKSQEEQHQLNASMFQSLIEIRRKMSSG